MITIEKELIEGTFERFRIVFRKDGQQFARFESDVVDNIMVSVKMTREEAIEEVKAAVKYELADPTLESEVDTLLDNFYKES